MSKRMNKHFIEGKTQMVDKHIKIINSRNSQVTSN